MKEALKNAIAKTRNVGDRIRIAREAAGYTLEELAERIGIGAETLNEIEEGYGDDPDFYESHLVADAIPQLAEFILFVHWKVKELKRKKMIPLCFLKSDLEYFAEDTPTAIRILREQTEFIDQVVETAEAFDEPVDVEAEVYGIIKNGDLEWYDNALVWWVDESSDPEKAIMEYLMYA